MTDVTEVMDEMVSIANDNIEDPNSYRANDNGSWIYRHFPKYGKNSSLPRIGIHYIDEDNPPVGLGTIATRTDADIQATIVVREGKKYDYDNDGENEQEEDLLQHLKQRMKDEIEDKQKRLTDLGEDVSYVKLLSSQKNRPPSKNVIFLFMTFEARIDEC